MQDAKGYSALEAGAAMTPLAFGLVIGAVSGIKLNARLGTAKVVAAGLLGLAVLLASSLFWSVDMPYWPIGLWFFGDRDVDGLDHGPGDRLGHGRRAARRSRASPRR